MVTEKMLVDAYKMIHRAAYKYTYGQIGTVAYDTFVSVGIDALIQAQNTYVEGPASFSTYVYLLIKNQMINNKLRNELHELPTQDGENDEYDFSKYDGAVVEIRDFMLADTLKKCILRAADGNERNAKIVELYIGFEDGPYDLGELAEMFNVSHETCRLACKNTFEALKSDPTIKVELYGKVG